MRKIFSILILLAAWYLLCNGITSFLMTTASLVYMKDQVSFRSVQWCNAVLDPILIIGLILMFIGTFLWNRQRWRTIIGSVILAAGIYSSLAALLVLFAQPKPSEGFHVPTLTIGYILFAVVLIVLGVVFITGQKKLPRESEKI